ncbi:hypothetical protein [Listeria monocytogenes]|uniref:hypothetical protein n=1 Tax=Listeria monocytogenes TaxID=1639 RepID=UPI000873CC7A|nr:hypothetical protein [Listeria monocytogenes]EHC6230825.1 hypothetical protein [Listeria monocytogenes serotype 1/2a]EAD0720630.1 hypothetical protein [Listeria monocytogenes]ECW3433026.1 hypothetical protein [Listeria monocytogenes]ECW7469560.1 hypothetical protein [Listeria monocytogenes]EJN2653012.1 hypothetical protein [Listeria monocytogenes]
MKEFNLLDCLGKAINTVEIQKILNITNIDENSNNSATMFGISKNVELHFRKAEIIQFYLENESIEMQETFKESINQMLATPNDMLFLNAMIIRNNSLFNLGYLLPASMEINKTIKAELMDRLGEPYLILLDGELMVID